MGAQASYKTSCACLRGKKCTAAKTAAGGNNFPSLPSKFACPEPEKFLRIRML